MAMVSRGSGRSSESQEIELARHERDVIAELEDKLREEERIRDEQRSIPRRGGADTKPYYVSPFTEAHFGRPLEYRGAVRRFPSVILDSFAQLQICSYQGLFPEIHRAWVTIDNVIYIWDYLTEENVCIIDALDQVVVSVGLARPDHTVFADFIQYVLVAATPTAVHVFAIAFSDGTPEGALDVRSTEFRVSTDGVIMRKIVGTVKGRIFMAGGDGNMYELLYEHEGDSFFSMGRANKCRKINLTSGIIGRIIPSSMLKSIFTSDADEIIDLAIDEARNILYSLSAKGSVQAVDLGADGMSHRIVPQKETDVYAKAQHYCRKNHTGNEQRFIQHNFRALSIHVVPPTDSRIYHAVVVLDAGFRIYLQTAMGEVLPGVRPDRLDVVDIRFPPQNTVWDDMYNEDLTERTRRPPDWVSHSSITYHHAFYSDGVLILAEEQAEGSPDHVVGFCEDGSTTQAEVVCELTQSAQRMDTGVARAREFGRVRAIAEEPFIQFPISGDRDRARDQLRYLVATSATPDADQRRAMEGAAGYSRMIAPLDAQREHQHVAGMEDPTLGSAMVRTIGPWVTHLASKFGVALGENSQALTSSRLFVILTTSGIHVVARVRPIDVLCTLLSQGSLEHQLRNFELVYGQEETCSLLYLLCSQVPSDVGFAVGRALLAHAGPPLNMPDIVTRAKDVIRSWYSITDRPQHMPSSALGPAANFTFQYKGLLTAFSRIVRPVWLKPLATEENVPVAPLWVLFLQPPELEQVIDAIVALRETVAVIYSGALKDPIREFFINGQPDKLDQNRIEDVHVRLLFNLLERTLHALRLLLFLAQFWAENKKIRLPLDPIQAWTVADLVTKRDAHEKIKMIMSQVLQPSTELTQKADELTNRLSTQSFLFFSLGDQLVFEARKEIMQGKKLGVDSTERRIHAETAARNLVKAAVYWRTKADVDALDGGLDRNNRRLANDGLALELLKLAISNPEVHGAIVDMSMLAALNFGAKPYIPRNEGSGFMREARTGDSVATVRAKKEYEAAALGALDEGSVAMLRQRCFNVVIDAVSYLVQPARRAMMGVGIEQRELDQRAYELVLRALNCQDYEFHCLLYDWLLRNNLDDMFYAIPKEHEHFVLDYLGRLPDPRESVERQHKYFTHNDRHVDAMVLMEKTAMDGNADMDLDDRIGYLERAKGSARLASQTGGWEAGQTYLSENIESRLNDQLDIAKMQQRIRNRLQGLQRDDELRHDLDKLERGFMTASVLYNTATKYSLWAEALLIVNMCSANGGGVVDRVKDQWRSIIYNALPRTAVTPTLQQWFDNKAGPCQRPWGPNNARPAVGKQEGRLGDNNNQARASAMQIVRELAREMGVVDGQPHVAFPLEFILQELLELEFRLDEALGAHDPSSWTHMAWMHLWDGGFSFKDLFRAHVEILKKLRDPVDYRLHVLDSISSLTKRWWAELQADPTGAGSSLAILDRSTQGFVVRQLEQLSSSQLGRHGVLLADLSTLKKRFQFYPDMMDLTE